MSIAEVARWLAPVLNYDSASVDEAAAAEWCDRLRLAHAGMPGLAGIRGATRKPRQKTAVKKRLSPLLTRFADDGCLKMSNNAAERAIRPIALGGKNYFLLVPTPEDGVR